MSSQHGDTNVDSADCNHSACLDALPEIWAEILKRVPQDDRLRHVALVGRRFSEACRDPSVWPELQACHPAYWAEADWRSFLRWLALRASGLQKLVVGSLWGKYADDAIGAAWGRRTRELLALLAASAPQLRSLEHWYPNLLPDSPAAALPELGGLSQLTSLTLGFGQARVSTEQVDALVQTLPLLQQMVLVGVQALKGGFPVSIATSCSQLRHLVIGGGRLGAVPPELGLLTALTELDFSHAEVSSLPDSISRLSELRKLTVNNRLCAPWRPNALPPGLTACRQLTWLRTSSTTMSPVLARLQSLRALHVDFMPEQPPHELHWTQLTALTELTFNCHGWDSLDTLLDRLSGISSLCKLCINDAALDDLPAGPYLHGLESLRLDGCKLKSGVPAGLVAATQLRSLDLGYQNRGIFLTAADVAVLSSLPALVTLSIRQSLSMSQQGWDARVAELEAAYIAQGRSPPEIIQAEAGMGWASDDSTNVSEMSDGSEDEDFDDSSESSDGSEGSESSEDSEGGVVTTAATALEARND